MAVWLSALRAGRAFLLEVEPIPGAILRLEIIIIII
jgi:hypothetical protein